MQMTAIIVILILLTFIMLIPLKFYALFIEGILSASAYIWFYKLTIFPSKKAAKSPELNNVAESDTPTDNKEKAKIFPEFTFNDWTELIQAGFSGLRKFRKSLCFNILKIKIIVSAPDPYDTVMHYNAINGLIGSLLPFFESNFRVEKKSIYVDLDMESNKSTAEFEMLLSVRVGAVLAIALILGIKFLNNLIKNKLRHIHERVGHSGKQQIERNDAVNNEQH
jgi:hypothetical protein